MFNQYAGNIPVSEPLNVRRAAKIRFAQSNFRTLHALYNFPATKFLSLWSRFTLSRAYGPCLTCQRYIFVIVEVNLWLPEQ